MSPVHGNQGQPFARPAAPSQNNNQWGQQQPAAAQQGYGGYAPAPGGQGYAAQPVPGHPAQGQGYAPQQPAPQGYAQGGYGQPAYGGAGGYGADPYQPAAAPAPTAGYGASTAGRAPASYAPQFEPYTPAAPAPATRAPQQPQYAQPQGYAPQGYDYGSPAQPQAPQHAQAYAQGYAAPAPQSNLHQHHMQPAQPAPQSWGQPQPHAEPRGFDLGTYSPSQPGYGGAQEPSLAPQQQEWAQDGYAQEPQFYGNEAHDQHGEYGQAGEYGHEQNGADLGFGQAAGGELDQGYVDEEAQDYEPEAPSRLRRPMMIAAVLAGAIMVGGGSMYGYKALFGGAHPGDPPVVKSASTPTKVKPDDAGGKQFAHTDSKVMGRLGDGSAEADASGSDVDANGTRKVSTLVVGRDGSIQAPSSGSPAAVSPPPVVPGLTVVDGLGTSRPMPPPQRVAAPTPPPAPPVQEAEAAAPVAPARVVNSVKTAPAPIKVAPPADSTGSIEPEADQAAAPAAPVAKPKKIKTAAATPAAAPVSDAASTSVATTGSGFVAVLASVPRSTSSRMDALKRFADMQQKYGGVLAGKTPDVAEANLGTKGNYHRLVVGPPGSREQASAVCTQLKSQGYADCWVTSY